MKTSTWVLYVLVGTLALNQAAIAKLWEEAAVQEFASDMQDQHGFSREELETLFDEAQVLQSVLDAMSRPAEAKPWYQYRKIFLTPGRIREGVSFWQQHRESLQRAEKEYGVAPEVIVAIIGVETYYGERKGGTRVIDSLATLAFRHPRRGTFFKSELEHFLLLTREESLDPLSMNGSYAGAMGVPQFISSSYRSYAVDFDGNDVRDLMNSEVDAIGSVANYLERHGWQPGAKVAVPASVEGERYGALLDLGIKPVTPVAEMRAYGVQLYDQAPDAAKGALVEFELADGTEYWVGLQNFYTITRYNHSALYAMAVFQLAEKIRAEYLHAQG